MAEIEMIKRLGEALAPSEAESSLPRRLSFATATAPRPQRQRWALRLGVAAALGLAIIAGAAITKQSEPPPRSQSVSATTVLQNAALVARSFDTPEPQPNQYVFTETASSTPAQLQQPDGSIKTVSRNPTIGQMWLSVDGSGNSASRQRPQRESGAWTGMATSSPCGRPLPAQGSTELGKVESPCPLSPAYLKTLPSSPPEMLLWLYGGARREGRTASPANPSRSSLTETQDSLAFENAKDLLTAGKYLTAEQRAAVYEALARMPGVIGIAEVRDGADRAGVGVRLAESETLIFDSVSHSFLGTLTTAVLRQAVVDEPGDVPS